MLKRRALVSSILLICSLLPRWLAYARAQESKARASRKTGKESRASELRRLAMENRSLSLRLKELRKELEKLQDRMKALDAARQTRPELIRRLDALQARLKMVYERVQAVAGRQADLEQRQAFLARPSEPAAEGWRTGYSKGFFFRSPSKRFELRVQGFIRGMYGLSGVFPDEAEDPELDPHKGLDQQGFRLLNARLGFNGYILSPRVRFALWLEAAGSPVVKQATVSFLPFDFLEIQAGQLKVPNSYQFLICNSWLLFSNRSPATLSFMGDYDLGALLTFRQWKGRVFQQIGVFNGEGPGKLDENRYLRYLVRFGVTPFGKLPSTEDDILRTRKPKLHLAISGSYNKVQTGDLDNDGERDESKGVFQVGAELAFMWRGLSLQAEFFFRLEDHGKILEEQCPPDYRQYHRTCLRYQKYYGVYAQAAYYIWRGLQAGVRYSMTDVFDNGISGSSDDNGYWIRSYYSPLAARGLGPSRVHSATFLVAYDLMRHNARVGLEYTSFWELSFWLDDVRTQEDRQVHSALLFFRLSFM